MSSTASIKTDSDIQKMLLGGKMAADILTHIMSDLKVGVSTLDIDRKIEKLIVEKGGESSFKRVAGYKHSSCICINDQIVHTPPSNQLIKDGDVVCVDMGVFFGGFHTDVADTKVVGKSNEKKDTFLDVGKKTLESAIERARAGAPISDISEVIWENITKKGFHIVPSLTGHGVGRELHEAPSIPGVVTGESKKTILKKGMTIAIEIIYSEKKGPLVYENNDGWSLVVKGGGMTACFEKTIAVTDESPLVITSY